jgi:hypothetical protein
MKYKLPILYSKANARERRAVREQYVQAQNGLCYWCQQPLSGEPPQHIKNKK